MEKNITIRNVFPEDYTRVYEVMREAFWNLYRPGATEHLTAKNIFESKDYIAELSFVILLDGKMIGCILYTESKIICGENRYDTVTFGPVAILPQYQKLGYGGLLISHSIDAARGRTDRAIIITGYRSNYARYGFVGAKKYRLAMSDGKFYYGLMAMPLYDGALDGIGGRAEFSDSLDDVSAEELEKFDRNFPRKEKLRLPCQEKFQQEATRSDTDFD